MSADEALISVARSYAERAIVQFHTLHLGPLDYNIATTANYLRTAAALIEQYMVALWQS